MEDYVAMKPCRFGGDSYRIGDIVPSGKVHPRKVSGLLRMGIIAVADSGHKAKPVKNEAIVKEPPSAESGETKDTPEEKATKKAKVQK